MWRGVFQFCCLGGFFASIFATTETHIVPKAAVPPHQGTPGYDVLCYMLCCGFWGTSSGEKVKLIKQLMWKQHFSDAGSSTIKFLWLKRTERLVPLNKWMKLTKILKCTLRPIIYLILFRDKLANKHCSLDF